MARTALVASFLLAACAPAAPESGLVATAATLPAYAHNDYLNARPLWDALGAGVRGVEVDCFQVRGRFLVGHDRSELTEGRTLEALYLDPLLERVRQQGRVVPGREPFIVNLELKTSGMATYQALHELLVRYREMLSVVEEGVVHEGPVRVILVGWQPALDWLSRQPLRFVAVQRHFRELPPDHVQYPSHLLALVSAEYVQLSRWPGLGAPPVSLLQGLERLADATHRVPGRLLRVYEAPMQVSVYRVLLEGGVDLIGVEDLQRTWELVRRASREAQ